MGLKILKYGAASTPVDALHCQPPLFEAKSLSIHDEHLFFMVERALLDSRNFDLPFQKTGVWTVNDEKEFQHFMELGVFGVITDIPDTMHVYRK